MYGKKFPLRKINPNNPNYEWLNKNYPGPVHLIFMQGFSAVSLSSKYYDFGFKSGYSFQNDLEFNWHWDLRELRRVRKIFLDKSKDNLDFLNNYYSNWEKFCNKNINAYEKAEKINFAELSDDELYDLYEELYSANSEQGARGYLADLSLTAGREDWLAEFIKNYTNDVETLTLPVIPSYSNEEAISLRKIWIEIEDSFENYDDFVDYLKKSDLWNKLEKHASSYYWVENSYFSKVLDADYFAKKLFEINVFPDIEKKLNDNKKKKEILLNKIGDNYLKNIIKLSELLTHVQDYRKMVAVRFSHFFYNFIEEFSKRTGIKKELFYHAVNPEMKEILSGDFDLSILEKRAVKNFIYIFPEGYMIFSGDEVDEYVNKSDFIEDVSGVNEVKGVPACHGIVRGNVRLVFDALNDKFKKGEILVTNNTTPDFVPLMKKAAAIVTEQGGITTHAAIVSRELGVPCVIGTKIATHVFKTGDKVEVDADKGIVRKI